MKRGGEAIEPLSDVESKLRRLSLVWLTDSTSKIMPKVFRKKNPYLRLLWVVFFVVCGTISFALAIKYVRDYLEYNVNANIQVVYESPALFPAVTFCNLNSFHKSRIQEYTNSVLVKNNLTQRLSKNETAIELTTRIIDMLRVSTLSDHATDQRKYFGFNIEEMLISCSYNGVKCGPGNFSWTQSYFYGNCFTFNSGKNENNTPIVIQKTSISGINSGLQLEVFVGDNSELYNYKSGLHVVLHNQTTNPMIDAEGIEVSTGAETNIAVKRTFINKLGSPYSDCKAYFSLSSADLNSTLYKSILHAFNETQYSAKQCYNLCYQVKIAKDCNCTDPRFVYPVLNTTKIGTIESCKNQTQLECLTKSIGQFQNNPISEECSQNCPMECLSIYYSLSTSVSNYPTKSYSEFLLQQNELLQKAHEQHLDYETLKYSMLKMNVFYEDMSYQTITESPALTWDILLGNIGGMLSLFIGVSIMTIGEVIEFIIEAIQIGFFKASVDFFQ